jgi:hypothetical protein
MGLPLRTLTTLVVVLSLAPIVSALKVDSSPFLSGHRADSVTPDLRIDPVPQGGRGLGLALEPAEFSVDDALALASCGPVATLERDWFGAVATDDRRQDQQMLLPVAVTGIVERQVPLVGGLLRTVTTTVHTLADVAVRAAWSEDYLEWSAYTDTLSVGLGADGADSLTGIDVLGAEGWHLTGIEFTCGAEARQVSYQEDPDAGSVQYLCVACESLPSDGWYLRDILLVDVYLAKATDYAELPTRGSLSACPDEVVAAVREKLADLQPTLDDVLQQQPERLAAGLPARSLPSFLT